MKSFLRPVQRVALCDVGVCASLAYCASVWLDVFGEVVEFVDTVVHPVDAEGGDPPYGTHGTHGTHCTHCTHCGILHGFFQHDFLGVPLCGSGSLRGPIDPIDPIDPLDGHLRLKGRRIGKIGIDQQGHPHVLTCRRHVRRNVPPIQKGVLEGCAHVQLPAPKHHATQSRAEG